MASAVLSASTAVAGMFCHHCQEVDHMPKDCGLVSADPFVEPIKTRSQAPSPVNVRSFRPHPELMYVGDIYIIEGPAMTHHLANTGISAWIAEGRTTGLLIGITKRSHLQHRDPNVHS